MIEEERHRSYLRRLDPGAYQGRSCVHWAMTMEDRATGWLNETFFFRWREIHLHALARYHLACPVFCLMPDHFHLLWIGFHIESDQRQAAKFFREHTNVAFKDAWPHRLNAHASSYQTRVAEDVSLQKNEQLDSQRPGKLNVHASSYRLQLQAYDHVLRKEERDREAFARVAFYILENPVRNGLVGRWSDYPFSGCLVPGYPTLDPRMDDYWEEILEDLREALDW